MNFTNSSGFESGSGEVDIESSNFLSEIYYIPGTFSIYYNVPRLIMDLIRPGSLPYDVLNPWIGRLITTALYGTEIIKETPASTGILYYIWLIPTIVVMSVLILLGLTTFIAGCIYSGCRHRGLCLGRKHTTLKTHSHCKYWITWHLMLLVSFLLLAAITMGAISNVQLSFSLNSFPHTALVSIQDAFQVFNSTFTEATTIFTDIISQVISTSNNDYRNIAASVGRPLQNSLLPLNSHFIANGTVLLNDFNQTQSRLIELNASISVLSQYDNTLSELRMSLNNLMVGCRGDAVCKQLVPTIPLGNPNAYSELLFPDEAINVLSDLNISHIKSHFALSAGRIRTINQYLSDKFANYELAPEISSELYRVIRLLNKTHDSIFNPDTGVFSQLRNSMISVRNEMESYESIRHIVVLLLLHIPFLVILCTFLTGMCCGICGYSGKRAPTDRSRLSHFASQSILVAIGLSFVICGVMFMVTGILYLVVFHYQKFCDDLAPPSYTFFSKSADVPSVWNGNTLLSSFLYTQFNFTALRNLSISDLFNRCSDDESLFQALQLEEKFNFSELTRPAYDAIEREIDFDQMDYDDILRYIMDGNTSNSTIALLLATPENIMDTLNIAEYRNMIAPPIFNFDQQRLYDNLTSLASYLTNTNTTLNMLMGEPINAAIVISMRNSIKQDLDALQQAKVKMIRLLDDLSNPIQTNLFEISGNSYVGQAPHLIRQELNRFINHQKARLHNYLSNSIIMVINRDLGSCRSLSAAYKGLHLSVCHYVLEKVNGLWFSLMCSAVIPPFLIILGTILRVFLKKAVPLDYQNAAPSVASAIASIHGKASIHRTPPCYHPVIVCPPQHCTLGRRNLCPEDVLDEATITKLRELKGIPDIIRDTVSIDGPYNCW